MLQKITKVQLILCAETLLLLPTGCVSAVSLVGAEPVFPDKASLWF